MALTNTEMCISFFGEESQNVKKIIHLDMNSIDICECIYPF